MYIAQKVRVMFTRFAKCDLRPRILKKKRGGVLEVAQPKDIS